MTGADLRLFKVQSAQSKSRFEVKGPSVEVFKSDRLDSGSTSNFYDGICASYSLTVSYCVARGLQMRVGVRVQKCKESD